MWKQHKFSDKIYALLAKIINSLERWLNQHKDLIQFLSVMIAFAGVIFAYYALSNNEKTLQQSIKFSNESMNLSKQALCIQKEVEYRNIAPPTIIVSLKDNNPIFQDNQTAMMTFQFHIIPNSKTYFYPDADSDITNFRGFSDTTTEGQGFQYLDNIKDINHMITIAQVEGGFPYPPLDYRNETTMDITYGVYAERSSKINFRQYPLKNPINVSMNFTFKLKDAYGHNYSDTVYYNITIVGGGNLESINQPKVFDFKRPENYTC